MPLASRHTTSMYATKFRLWFSFCSPKVLLSSLLFMQLHLRIPLTIIVFSLKWKFVWLFHFLNPSWNLLRFIFFLAFQLRATSRRSAWERNTSLLARMWRSLGTSLRWRRGRIPCNVSMRRRRRRQFTWCDSWTGTAVTDVEVLATSSALPSWAVNVVASLKLSVNRISTSRPEWWVAPMHEIIGCDQQPAARYNDVCGLWVFSNTTMLPHLNEGQFFERFCKVVSHS